MVPEINYVAILAAVVANVVIGFLWYGPLFGKTWAGLLGIDFTKKPGGAAMAKSMLFMIAGAFLMAYVFYHGLIFGNAYLGTTGISAGLQAAFYYWLGFIVPVTWGVVIWENKPWKLFFINAGYYLVALGVMGIILMSFK